MIMATIIRAAALSNFSEVAQQMGLAPRALLREVGLDPGVLNVPEMRVPASAITGVLEIAAARSGCDTFGLRMAESRRLADFGVVSLLIAHQQTLREALDAIIRYRHLLNDALVMQVEEDGELSIVRQELVIDSPTPMRQAHELAIGALFRMFSLLLGPRWRPYSVNFMHPPPADLSVHRRMFGPDVQFDSEFTGIVCARADLDRPNPAGDPRLAQYARQFVEGMGAPQSRSCALQVREAAYLMMPLGPMSITQIAHAIGVNVRTMQRRLAAENVQFSHLIDDVRRDLSVRYLANPNYSMTEISRMVGYDRLSSFTRWFTGEFGMAPTQWRSTRTSEVQPAATSPGGGSPGRTLRTPSRPVA
jgi:AraC-like DNA-binding protein